ncbi:MAG: site-2 protease family protein [Chloroflexi bacterium]|nr:site-2 protease family protein [Chloroflexota bacterium]
MNVNLLAGVVFIAVFGIVILVHELGHFLVGRFFKVEIEEFGIGLPPKMLSLFRWKETEFTINWLPFGGFNRFKGENNPEVEGGLAAASAGVRLAVLFAGAIMNLLTGILVYTIIFSKVGIPNFDVVQVYEVTPGSPAAEAGFRVDDIILKINGEALNDETELRGIIGENLDQEISFTFQRGEEIVETVAVPLSSRSPEEGALGFVPSYGREETSSFLATLSYGTQTTFLHAQEILLMPARMLRGSLSPEEGRFIGFRGIYNIFQQTVDADVESREEEPAPTAGTPAPPPTYYTLNLIASLTITLGVFNLLPFPALDGGRIFFIIPELLFKKRVPAEFENIVHGVGMMLLLGFMLYINVMDFVNPVDILLP